VTLGTVFNAKPTAWTRLAEELKDPGTWVVATVGDGTNLTALPPFPTNFTVLSLVPARGCCRGQSPCSATKAPAPCSGRSAMACRWCAGPNAPTSSTTLGRRSGRGQRHDQPRRRRGAWTSLHLGRRWLSFGGTTTAGGTTGDAFPGAVRAGVNRAGTPALLKRPAPARGRLNCQRAGGHHPGVPVAHSSRFSRRPGWGHGHSNSRARGRR